jgi:probable HAF family extracellular repeat protein
MLKYAVRSILTAICLTLVSHAQNPKYNVTDLGTLGGSYSYAKDINAFGQIVGEASTTGDAQYHAFLYQNGTRRDLGTIAGQFSEAHGINRYGQIVGGSSTATNSSEPFLLKKGVMLDLGDFGGGYGFAENINGNGAGVGYADLPSTGTEISHAFLYQNGTMHDLGTLGGSDSYAYQINFWGQVVGSAGLAGDTSAHAFLCSKGSDAGPGYARRQLQHRLWHQRLWRNCRQCESRG